MNDFDDDNDDDDDDHGDDNRPNTQLTKTVNIDLYEYNIC